MSEGHDLAARICQALGRARHLQGSTHDAETLIRALLLAEPTAQACPACGELILEGDETATWCALGRPSRVVHARCGKRGQATGRRAAGW